jgi:hypothetical protein
MEMKAFGRVRLAIAVLVTLAGCVSAPKTPMAREDLPAGGVRLAEGDAIAVFVGSHVAPVEKGATDRFERTPVGNVEELRRAFVEGFRVQRGDARIEFADEALRSACFAETGEAAPGGFVLAQPATGDAACRALLAERRIRYLASVGGARSTTTTNELIAGGGIGVMALHDHVYEIGARVVDASTGAIVCEATRADTGSSGEGFMIGAIAFAAFPLPLFRFSDDTAFWKDVAWRTGYAVGACFVAGDGVPRTMR